MAADPSDDDKATLAELLRDAIAADRFPLSPRIRRLQAILAKLEVPKPPAEPLPPPSSAAPSLARRKRRR